MERALRARLGCAREALRHRAQGHVRKVVSATQMRAVLELVGNGNKLSSMTAEERARMVDLTLAYKFTEDDEIKVLNALQPREKGRAPKERRRPHQKFLPALFSYFTEGEWADMKDHVATEEITELVHGRAIALSGRTMSEERLKLVNSFS